MDSVNNVSSDHEYVLCYGKYHNKLAGIQRTFERYHNPDNDPRGPWILDNLSAGKPGGNTYYPIKDPKTGYEYLPPKGRYWPYSPQTMENKIKEGRIIFPKNSDGSPLLKRFQNEAKSQVLPISTWGSERKSAATNSFITALNTEGTKEIKKLFGDKVFSFPKSTQLIRSLILQGCPNDGVVLDFFAGSATTAEAIFKQNSEDGVNRKHICIQLDEVCGNTSEAYKSGYKSIPDISKERIRRSGQKVIEGMCNENWNKDIGFRVLKVDSSNMSDIYYSPDQISQDLVETMVGNIKEDRSDEDLLFQVLLDWSVDLTLPIRKETICNKTVFFVDDNALVACFDTNITEDLIKELAGLAPLRVVFRDDGFISDAVKINAEQIFKQLAPGTEVKSI